MDTAEISRLKEEIEELEKRKEILFKLGWQNESKRYIAAGIVFFFIGAFGVGDLFQQGLTWYNAAAIVVAFLAYKKATAEEKATLICRDEFHKAASKLDTAKEAYKDATYVPETPEESERKWREMMIELEQKTKPHS